MDRPLISLLLAPLISIGAGAGACGCRPMPPTPTDGGMAHYPGEVLRAVVRENPDNVVSALVDLTARHDDIVAVEYGDTTDYEHCTADYLVPEGSRIRGLVPTIDVISFTPGTVSPGQPVTDAARK